ncbi:MAG: nuclear transport factor 2 family protein [Acidobacteriaceae bacterium]
MTPEALWKRYAATWSLGVEEREPELAACLGEDVTYCDPNHIAETRNALSAYMDQFQRGLPGGQFQIGSVLEHHGRSLARWALHGKDGTVLQTGTSFGLLAEDGRLCAISGFFDPLVGKTPA